MRRGRGALLADDMGLGKTMQALCSIAAPFDRAVVVCPAIAKGVWSREVQRWRPDLAVTVLDGRGSFRWPRAQEVVVINYDILPKAVESTGANGSSKFWNLPPVIATSVPQHVMLLADEAHMLKAWSAQRTKNFRALRFVVKRAKGDCIAMTGTPMMNGPSELWSVLQAADLANEAFGSYDSFKRLFHAREEHLPNGHTHTVFGHPSQEVPQRLARVMLRRTKEQVLDLPPKLHEMLVVDCDAKAVKLLDGIAALIDEDLDRLDENEVFAAMAKVPFEKLARARAAVALAKLPEAVKLIEECEAESVKVVVFSSHLAPITVLGERPGWAVITGAMTAAQKTEVTERFQRGELKGVAATIAAAGTGITLTRGTREIFIDQDWTPALNEQAEDRCYRIGQTQTLLVTVLTASHPVDRRVNQLLVEKRARIAATVGAVANVARIDSEPEHVDHPSHGTVNIKAPVTIIEDDSDDPMLF